MAWATSAHAPTNVADFLRPRAELVAGRALNPTGYADSPFCAFRPSPEIISCSALNTCRSGILEPTDLATAPFAELR